MAKPNVIMILADDMGYGDIGCFGNPDVQTPNLDRLAANGICLTQHYSASPVCAPARAGLMTGRYPHRTGTIDTLEGRGLDRLCLEERTIADSLKSVGYATGLVGKWHLGAIDPRYHPNRRGFDETACFRGGWSDYWQWRLDYNGAFQKADGRYLTDVFTEEAVGFINRHREEPFFLHLTYNAPHFPMQVPDEEADAFRETGKFTEAVCRVYGMNRRMDKGIGRILDELDRLGLAENTLVFFASDNGPDFTGAGDMCKLRSNGDFNGEKCLTYEGGVRVPAIVRWPAGLKGGQRLHDVVHFTDWHPTLASITGAIPAPRGPLDGRNVVPVLRGEQASEERTLFWQWNRYTPVPTCNAAVRSGPWKLVRPAIAEAMHMVQMDADLDNKLKYKPEEITDIYRGPEPDRTVPPPPPPLLFNIDEDPYERQDLSAQHVDIVSKLQRSIDDWFDSVEADRMAISDTWLLTDRPPGNDIMPVAHNANLGDCMKKPISRGFTLIELLVVIAIIAILAAILFPIFASAKERARTSGCSSNLRQIGTAFQMYCDDHDGKVPVAVDAEDRHDIAPLPSINFPFPYPWEYKMMGRYCRSKRIWRCPSDKGLTFMWTNRGGVSWPTTVKSCYETWGSSYSYRTAVTCENWSNIHSTNASVRSTVRIKPCKYSDFKKATRVMLFFDPFQYSASNPPTAANWNAQWHMMKYPMMAWNMLYADGHVRMTTVAQLYFPGDNPYGYWLFHDWYIRP